MAAASIGGILGGGNFPVKTFFRIQLAGDKALPVEYVVIFSNSSSVRRMFTWTFRLSFSLIFFLPMSSNFLTKWNAFSIGLSVAKTLLAPSHNAHHTVTLVVFVLIASSTPNDSFFTGTPFEIRGF